MFWVTTRKAWLYKTLTWTSSLNLATAPLTRSYTAGWYCNTNHKVLRALRRETGAITVLYSTTESRSIVRSGSKNDLNLLMNSLLACTKLSSRLASPRSDRRTCDGHVRCTEGVCADVAARGGPSAVFLKTGAVWNRPALLSMSTCMLRNSKLL